MGGILYPNLSGKKSRGRISDNIWLVKKHLPGFPIISTTQSLSLNKETIWVDVHAFRNGISRTDELLSENFINLYQGELLPELYDDWLLVERERWRNYYLRSLRSLIRNLLQENKFNIAIVQAERLLREEPYDETTVRMLMETYAKVGRRGAALAIYEKFYLLSTEQLGFEPDRETKNLFETIYQQKTLPRQVLTAQETMLFEPGKILEQARTNLQQGERTLFLQMLAKLSGNLTSHQVLLRECLKFDEKFLWEELEDAEKIIQKSNMSFPEIQLREARLLIARQEYQQAQELLENVLNTVHRKKQPSLEAEVLIALSITRAELGENQDALLVLDRAIFLAEKVKSPSLQVEAYIQKGIFRNLMGAGEDAKELLTKAVKIARTYRLRPLLTQALDALGRNANYYGDYQSALGHLNECLELSRDIGVGALEAKSLLTLSGTLDFLGRYKETAEAIKNATKYYEEKQDLIGLARCYYNLSYSIVSVDEKNVEEAIGYSKQALQIFIEHEIFGWQASTFTALGYFQWLAGLVDQAIESFNSAIKLHTQLDEYRFIPENYAYIGLAYIKKQLSQKAFEYTQQAVQELAHRNLSDVASEIYYAHACSCRAIGDEKEAKLYTQLGYDLLLETASKIEEDQARSAFFQRDPMSRRLMQMAYNYDIAPSPQKRMISQGLPGSGHYRVDLSLTIDAGAADLAIQVARGNIALRRVRIKRILKESNIHGNKISVKEIAQLFEVSPRTIQRDIKIIAKEFSENDSQAPFR